MKLNRDNKKRLNVLFFNSYDNIPIIGVSKVRCVIFRGDDVIHESEYYYSDWHDETDNDFIVRIINSEFDKLFNNLSKETGIDYSEAYRIFELDAHGQYKINNQIIDERFEMVFKMIECLREEAR